MYPSLVITVVCVLILIVIIKCLYFKRLNGRTFENCKFLYINKAQYKSTMYVIVFNYKCLTPISTIFQLYQLYQLYRGCQFYQWRKTEYQEKTIPTTCSKSLKTLSHNVVSSTPRHEWGSNSQLDW